MVVLLLISAAAAGFAAESATEKISAAAGEKTPAEKKAKAAKPFKPQKLKGEITAMDAKAGTLSVKGATGEKHFTTQDAAKDAMEILQVGEQVRVAYVEKDGKPVATSVRRLKVKTASSEGKVKRPTKGSTSQTQEAGGAKKP
jgi:hypothetical protein